MRHVLTSVIGGQNDLDATVSERTVGAGERLVICSDGVYRGVSDDLLRRLAAEGTVKAAAESIVAAALERDGRDNISALVVGDD